jgi:hypothetical protein
MARKTIRAAQFMYYVPTGKFVKNAKTDKEQELMGIRHAFRGDVVDVPREEDVERGERGGSFEPEPEEVETEVTVDEPESEEMELDFSDPDSLTSWIQDEQPTTREVVDAADNDPEKAEALLAAENAATGGQPRKSVVSRLRRITQADEE